MESDLTEPPQSIDVCMPTLNSSSVIKATLEKLADSTKSADVDVNRLILIDGNSEDGTIDVTRAIAQEKGWELDLTCGDYNLPKARELAIQRVETEWFLFLDDDVRIDKGYMNQQLSCIASRVGAVQGRKASNEEEPWEWMRRRVIRGGTHATLIRTKAVQAINIPVEIEVLEDEYIRREVESNGFLWVFNHQALFEHEDVGRHNVGWKQGYIGGRYGLLPVHAHILAIGEATITGKPLLPRVIRSIGWTTGRMAKFVHDIDDV